MNELTKLLGDPIEGNEYIIKPINGEFWIEHKHVGSGEPLGQFLNKIWNAAIDAAAEGAKILHREGDPYDNEPFKEKELASWECSPDYFEVSKQSILNLKKITPKEGERK